MARSHITRTSVILTLLVAPSVGSAQCNLDEHQKLYASDGESYDIFGVAVAAEQNRLIVGAYGARGNATDSGAAYVFRQHNGQWYEEQKLFASDGAAGDYFGWSLDIDGTVAVIGARFDDDYSGSAYVFRYDGSQWVEEQKLVPSDGASNDDFGRSVSVSGDVVLIGVPDDDDGANGTGSAYVYRYDGSAWVEEQKLHASDAESFDLFGGSVSVCGSVALIGADYADGATENEGAAYVFRYDGSQWIEEQILEASDGGHHDLFGYKVSLSGDVALVSAPWDDPNGANSGSAYIFRYDGNSWVEEQQLTGPSGGRSSFFGSTICNDGDTLLLSGEHGNYGPDAAYVFRNLGGGWVYTHRLRPSDGEGSFGRNVAVSGTTAIVGAQGDHDVAWNAGAAYTYSVHDLVLDSNKETVQVGDWLEFTTCGGLPDALAMLFVVDVAGTSIFFKVSQGLFDGNQRWEFGTNVPPGLSGLVIQLQSLGILAAGKIGESNLASVTFQ